MSAFTNFEIVAHGYLPNSATRADREEFMHGRIKTSGPMEKCVHWLSDKNVPLFQKIGLVFSVTLAAVGTGLLIGYPILFSAVVLVPLAIWGKLSMNELARKTIEEYRRIPLAAINEAFGGQQVNFPVLDSPWEDRSLFDARSFLVYGIRLQRKSPAMQGKTLDGRQIFGFKVIPVLRELEANEEPTLIALYPKYNERSILAGGAALCYYWNVQVVPGFDFQDFEGLKGFQLDVVHLEMIQQIFVHKNHPKWKLAE